MEYDEDWSGEIRKQLESGEGKVKLNELEQCLVIHGYLYFRNVGGWLLRCVSLEEVEQRLKKTNDKHCEITNIPIYKLIPREGYFWPTMKQDASYVHRKCIMCQGLF